jgi:hypothetical protein
VIRGSGPLATTEYDAVVISTPDHHHFPATLRALKAKKHVYCEKPLTHTIWEAREVARLAKEAGVATQMGNQGNASEDLRVTTEWVKGGVIGKVKEVHCWSNRPIWPQGVTWPTEAEPIPESLDWDLWLGPAAERPYYSKCHPFAWRGFWDFGTGAFGVLLMRLTDRRFSATQYALFSSLFALPRVIAGPLTGFLVAAVGWPAFFASTMVLGIPGLLMLARFVPPGTREPDEAIC